MPRTTYFHIACAFSPYNKQPSTYAVMASTQRHPKILNICPDYVEVYVENDAKYFILEGVKVLFSYRPFSPSPFSVQEWRSRVSGVFEKGTRCTNTLYRQKVFRVLAPFVVVSEQILASRWGRWTTKIGLCVSLSLFISSPSNLPTLSSYAAFIFYTENGFLPAKRNPLVRELAESILTSKIQPTFDLGNEREREAKLIRAKSDILKGLLSALLFFLLRCLLTWLKVPAKKLLSKKVFIYFFASSAIFSTPHSLSFSPSLSVYCW